MGCEIDDVWSEPVEEDPRLRSRREAVAAQARQRRLRRIGAGLIVLGSIILLGALGGLVVPFFLWLFETWFG